MFNENGLESEIKAKKRIHGRIEQEEAIEYKVEYCEVSYECEHKQEVDCIKSRPFLIDWEYIVRGRVEYFEIIEDQKVEYCEIIEDQKVEYCEIIEDQKVEIIDYQKVEDINMPKSGYEINLSKEELRLIARERGVKKYENISKSRLIKEINKLKPSKGLKKAKKIVSCLLLKGKRSIGFKPRKKSFCFYRPIKISGAFSDLVLLVISI